ncbi:MAG: metallophosphoesterase family protein [Promethearchaeota archaeon]
MLIGIISDTHIEANMDYYGLMDKLKKAFNEVDLIIHAGDVCNEKFLEDLRKIAPVECVCGNSDDSTIKNKYSPFKIIEIDNVKIGICHEGISESVIKQEDLKIIIQGHTHIPEIKEDKGYLILNPGSTTFPKSPPIKRLYQRQRPPYPSVIILTIEEGISSAYLYSFKLS